MTTNIDKLNEIVGEIPGASLASVVEEIRKAEEEKTQGKLKELVIAAMQAKDEIDAAEKVYLKSKAECDKKLGSLLKKIEGVSSGHSTDNNTNEAK